MKRLTALAAAALLPVALAVVSSGTASGTALAATEDVPTYVPGVAGWPGGGGFDVVYRTSTKNVAFRRLSLTGVWSTPTNLEGRLVGGPAITFAAANPHVYGRGTDNELWERVRVGGTWQPWTKVGGMVLSSAPAAAGRPDGRVDVFARDASDQLRTRTYLPGSGWGDWTSLGGVLYGSPAATVTGSGTLTVAATRQDYAVWTRTLTGSTWSEWTSLGGRTYSAPGIAVEPDGTLRVVIRDATTNALHLRTRTGDSWSAWQAMGGLYVDGPALSHAGGKTAVVARGRDSALWLRTITGTTWTTDQRAWVRGPAPVAPTSLRGKNLTTIPTTSKVAALTFDGAWSAAGVSSIRGTLQRENVPATFFLVGDFVRGFPVYSNLLASSGWVIGNHSDNHPDFTKISDATATTEVTAARTAVFQTNGAETRPIFRFPYGAYTASDITLLNDLGYFTVGWSVDSLGWQGTSGGQTVTSVVNRVLAAAKPGMIVLMHVGDNPDDRTTLDADALPQIIQGLRDRGYTFVTLDSLY